MLRGASTLVLTLEAAGLALVVACHGAGATTSPADSDDGGAQGALSPEAGEAGEEAGETSTPTGVQIRIAQLSPDLPPVDVCVAPHGSTAFQGPLLAAAAQGDGGTDAGSAGLGYAQVSAYLAITPGQYDVRVVLAGARDCSQAIAAPADGGADATVAVADATDLPALALGSSTTLLVAGDLSPSGGEHGLVVAALEDDSTLSSGAVALRAVNAMPGAASLDFGLGSFETTWVPLLTGVAFASAGHTAAPAAGSPDANGYLPVAPLASQVVSARDSSDASADEALAADVDVAAGSIVTFVAMGRSGDAQHPPELLLCVDSEPAGGLLADCSVLPGH